MGQIKLLNILREILSEGTPIIPDDSQLNAQNNANNQQSQTTPQTPITQPPPQNQAEEPPKETEDQPLPIKTINKDEALRLIKDTKGRFFTVQFIKKNSEKRLMNCRLGVRVYLKGGELPYNPEPKGLLPVYSIADRDYRIINTRTITDLKVGNQIYKVV